MINKKIKDEIISLAEELNLLPRKDYDNVIMFLENNELEIAFDTLSIQLFEVNMKISKETYKKFEKIGNAMELPKSTWNFLTDLIDNNL